MLNTALQLTSFAQTGKDKTTNSFITPQSLTTEFRKNPKGLDILKPRLFWKYSALSTQKNLAQTAFQIIVASTPALLKKDSGDLWNSGKISGSRLTHIIHQGKTLNPGSQCFWKVRG